MKRKTINSKPRYESIGSLRLEQQTMERLRLLADLEHRSLSNFLRLLVIEGLERRASVTQ